MIEYYKAALNKYADFTGRARRSEYWYFTLGNVIIMLLLYIPLIGSMATSGGEPGAGSLIFSGLVGIFALGIVIPSLAVAVRRLHDTGKSGWFYLISFVPFIGGIILIVFMCQDSEPGANKWGPNPKTGTVADASSHLVD